MAVLPTPASPISTGLFLVRRCSLHRCADLVVAPDHRVELALLGALSQVDGVEHEQSELKYKYRAAGPVCRSDCRRPTARGDMHVTAAAPATRRQGGQRLAKRRTQLVHIDVGLGEQMAYRAPLLIEQCVITGAQVR